MADPISILIAPDGLQILDSSPYSVDEFGLTKAVVTYICYPPTPNKYPQRGSVHPNYPELLLAEIEVRVDVFAFLTCIYYGILGYANERQDYHEWYELISPITYKTSDTGDTEVARQAIYQKKYTRTFRGVSTAQPVSSGEHWSVSATQKGHVWVYSREYNWEQPLPIPPTNVAYSVK